MQLLETVYCQEGAEFEVIVVDDRSDHGTPDAIAGRFPRP